MNDQRIASLLGHLMEAGVDAATIEEAVTQTRSVQLGQDIFPGATSNRERSAFVWTQVSRLEK